QATPAVVSIIGEKDVPVYEQLYQSPVGMDIFGQSFTTPELRERGTARREVGEGTGFFVSKADMVATNRHVVTDEAADYIIITADGTRYPATIIGRDPSNDLAILKAERTEDQSVQFPFLEFAEDEPLVGQSVIAIGYALGRYSNSVS